MLICADIDGTIDADPPFFQWLLAAARQAGAQVAILTGVKGVEQVTPDMVQAKRDYLAQLGVTAYDTLVVFPDGGGKLPQLKAQWCEQHGADALFDNDRGNAEAAMQHTLVLVPWGTRVGKKRDGERG